MKIKKFILISIFYISGCSLQGPQGPIGPKGEPGIKGDQGPIGLRGLTGKSGKGLSKDQENKIEKIINSQFETIVASSSYSFGFAPTITGFIYLTNHGRIFKQENKNPETLGSKIELITRIDDRSDFISISRIVYGEDIKQFFSVSTENGIIYTSIDLKQWTSIKDSIILQK